MPVPLPLLDEDDADKILIFVKSFIHFWVWDLSSSLSLSLHFWVVLSRAALERKGWLR